MQNYVIICVSTLSSNSSEMRVSPFFTSFVWSTFQKARTRTHSSGNQPICVVTKSNNTTLKPLIIIE